MACAWYSDDVVAGKNKDVDNGSIRYDFQSKIHTISYALKDLAELKNAPRYGDKVCWEFFFLLLKVQGQGSKNFGFCQQEGNICVK